MKKVLAAALLLSAGAAAWMLLQAPGPEVRIEIPPGAGALGVGRLLEREGVVRSGRLFGVLAKAARFDRSLKPGVFVLRRELGCWKALTWIRDGRSEQVKVIIPEGFMASQIASRLHEAGVTDRSRFMEYVRANNLEGFLFPSGYFFARRVSASDAAHAMYAEFRRAAVPVFERSPQRRFTIEQAVILASIVQREARRKSEMPMIAAVYANRLQRRMRLEADPTVQYALGKDSGAWKRDLSRRDLRIFSRFNTYQYFGLPAGPICSPGLDALRAALEPAETDALYFVADNAGGHVFSRTLDEHLNARNRIRRLSGRGR